MTSEDGVELRYFHANRRTTQVAALRPGELATALWPLDGVAPPTPRSVLHRLGLDPDDSDVRVVLASLGLGDDWQQPLDLDTARRLLGDDDLERNALRAAARSRALLWEYVQQEGAYGTDAALVDTGWVGRMHGALAQVVSMHGRVPAPVLLFGRFRPIEPWAPLDDCETFLFDDVRGHGLRGPDHPFAPAVVETFCTSTEPRTTGYVRDSRSVVPVSEQDVDDPGPWDVPAFQEAVLAVADRVERELLSRRAGLEVVVSDVLTLFWRTPDRDEAQALGAFVYEDDPLGLSRKTLAKPFTGRELVGLVARMRWHDNGRWWHEGSLAISPPHVERTGLLLDAVVGRLRRRSEALVGRLRV